MLYFTIQNLSPRWDESGLRSGGCEMTILSSIIVDYRSDYPRIILESSLYWRKHFRHFHLRSTTSRLSWQAQYFVRLEGDFTCSAHWKWRFICDADHCWHFILCGRRSIWWGWRVTLLAPRIGNDVSYVTHITDDFDFEWQAQYLVRLEGDFTCSAHWKWRFICDADHWWHSFCVAGAVFGEVGGWLYLLRALEMTFHMWRGVCDEYQTSTL